MGRAGSPCPLSPPEHLRIVGKECLCQREEGGPPGWPIPFLPSPRPYNSLAHRESRAQDCPCESLCAARAGSGKRGAGGLGCRMMGQQKHWLSPPVQQYHWLWQEGSSQQSRGARAPKGSADCHLPLKLDQSEKSEVLRGSGSGLTTSSICRKEPVSPAGPGLSLPTHLSQVGPRADAQSDRQTNRFSPEEGPVLPGPS